MLTWSTYIPDSSEFLPGSPKAGALVSSQIGQAFLESSNPWVSHLFPERLNPEGVRVTLPLLSPSQRLLKQNGRSRQICQLLPKFKLGVLWGLKAIWGSSCLHCSGATVGEVGPRPPAWPSLSAWPLHPACLLTPLSPSSLRREINIFPQEAIVTFWPKLNCAEAPGELAGGLWAPYNSKGAGGWAPGSCGPIHQLGGFDSDNGLISSDRKGRGRFMAPLPPGLDSGSVAP